MHCRCCDQSDDAHCISHSARAASAVLSLCTQKERVQCNAKCACTTAESCRDLAQSRECTGLCPHDPHPRSTCVPSVRNALHVCAPRCPISRSRYGGKHLLVTMAQQQPVKVASGSFDAASVPRARGAAGAAASTRPSSAPLGGPAESGSPERKKGRLAAAMRRDPDAACPMPEFRDFFPEIWGGW